MDNNTIPVTDVTESEQTEEQIMEQARAQAAEHLARAKNFILLEVDDAGCQIIAGCSDVQVMQATLGLASMVGAAQIGKSLEQMPPQIANAVALTQGLGQLNAFARQVAADVGAQLASGAPTAKH